VLLLESGEADMLPLFLSLISNVSISVPLIIFVAFIVNRAALLKLDVK